ncbi:MAG: 16S rRNA (cytidine(1402)-2'-O)-methyltransferase [Deltaproteobacteria bacterium]|nr:16S rRNA (cytidine(1402)-2'-O)-methyltransferase [Deltaproteobacteria bacterium]
MEPAPGTLYVVPTPIGNLGDLTLRALEILGRVDLVAAEDTRTARKLFSRYQLQTPLLAFHDHSGPARRQRLLDDLRAGKAVALISEAGMPGVSDPGFELVRAVIAADLPLVVLPGPCAAVTALVGSGLPLNEYFFAGFLPARDAARRQRLRQLREIRATLVFYESPRRLPATLAAIHEVLGNRQLAIARELSKLHEEYIRGPVAAIREREAGRDWRGEITLVVAGAPAAAKASEEEVAAALERLQAGGGELSGRDLVAALQAEFPDWPRRELYRLVLAARNGER